MAERTCSEEACTEPHLAKGLCRHHYDARRDLAKMRAHGRLYYAAHREVRKQYRRQRYWANRDQALAAGRHQARKHRAKRSAREKAWRHANPERTKGYERRYRAAKKAAIIGQVTPHLLAAKLAYWGHRCWMCGGPPVDVDHVKPLAKGGPHMLANLRPACRSCNSTKNDQWPYPITGGPAYALSRTA